MKQTFLFLFLYLKPDGISTETEIVKELRRKRALH